MPFRQRKVRGSAIDDAARLMGDGATPAPGDTASAGTRPRARPTRLSVGLPGLMTISRTNRPTASPLQGAPSSTRGSTSGQPMPARLHETVVDRAQRGFAQLHPVAQPDRGQPSVPRTLRAMHHLDGLLDEVQSTFGASADSNRLSLRLLGAVPRDNDSDRPYLSLLVLTTALRSAGAETPEEAIGLIAQAQRGEASPQLFRLQRVLAATTAGTRALAHLQGMQERPAQMKALREALQLCSDLERRGVQMHTHGSAAEVVQALEARDDTRMHADIGQHDDAPLQLLAKAARHALAQHGASGRSTTVNASDRAAYVAWKQGGFVESGAGSDFEKAIGRMHKFLSYVDRADHGPRTLGHLLRDASAYLGRAVGVGKSPLSAARHGTLGADRGLRQEQSDKVQQCLHPALEAAVGNLLSAWQKPGARQSEGTRHAHLARAAVLDLWRETGSTEHRVIDVVSRARELAVRAGTPAQSVFGPGIAERLRGFTRSARADAGEPVVRVGLRALEGVATARVWHPDEAPAGAPTPAQRREQLVGLLTELHQALHGGTDTKPLFRLSDLRQLLRGTPREGPTAADAHRVMSVVAQSPRVGFSTLADGGRQGVGGLGALALRVGALVGTPIAYPVLGLEQGRSATVSVGQYPTGGRLFIGTETTRSTAIGLGAGWVAPPLAANLVTALAVGQVAAGQDRTHTHGLSITARNDTPGGHDKVSQVIDFMFDQARRDTEDGRPETASTLWHRYAERFGDDPHLGVSWVDERSVTTGASASATAIARVAAGPQTSIGPGLTAGLGASATRLERGVNGHGADVPLTIHSRQGTASLSIGVTQTPPFAAARGDGPVSGWGAGLPQVGASLEWRTPGGLGIARIGRDRDGSLNAGLTQREILFSEAKAMIAYVERRRADWEAAIAARDDTGSTRLEDARERLNSFIAEAAAVHTPRALHGEFVSLSPAVADQINALEARLNTLLGRGDAAASARELSAEERRECHALQNEVHRLLHTESSWMPGALYSTDSQAQSRVTGLNVGLRTTNQELATNLHVTALLVPGAPHPG